MKKILLFCFSACLLMCVSCEKSPWEREFGNFRGDQSSYSQRSHNNTHGNDSVPPGENTDQDNPNPDGVPDNSVENDVHTLKITKLYSVVMRRELPYPFQAYVLQVSNGEYFYMMRYRYGHDLRVGDNIQFSVFSFCPNEIAQINGYDLGDGSEAVPNVDPGAGEYLVASDAIEKTVKSTFDMKIRYSITFWPISTKFIETTDGNLLFVKNSKLNVELLPGDRIVYNVYTLFPNEILAIKKL
ncbi:MAG: hypothetical protein MJ212_03315 [Alphaproteobacteria bacterium]|nr:hypothetical protein [Alphaproteobacteria bacterium]